MLSKFQIGLKSLLSLTGLKSLLSLTGLKSLLCQIGHKSLLRQGLSEHEFYGDFVYKLKKIVGSSIFSGQFILLIYHYKKIGYNTDCMLGGLTTLLSSFIACQWV